MMHSVKVNLLGGDAEQKARRTTAIYAVAFAAAVGILAAVGAGASYRAAARGTSVFAEVGNLPIISDIRRLAFGDDGRDGLISGDRMTFLIMGVGGEGHDGPELTDTILIATVDLKEHRVGMLSIPRDLAYPLGSGRFVKINSVNAYAEQANPGQGARETADAFEELLGIKINHVIKVNFNAFADFIDALGGVDIHVDRTFVDNEYPTSNDKWQTVSFKEGDEHMDGARALIYSRSRHGSNGEGSDFARSARQQKVLVAVKTKLLSAGTLTNPGKLIEMYEAISSNVQTDLTPWEMIKIAPLVKTISDTSVVSHVLTNENDGELVSQMVGGAYMLFPKEPDWSEIRDIAQNPFSTDEELSAASDNASLTNYALEIRNGTNITGFASQKSEVLKAKGYTIQNIGNAARRDYEKTVIYDLTGGKYPAALEYLRGLLQANVSPNIPAWAGTSTLDQAEQRPVDDDQTDFLIILGGK